VRRKRRGRREKGEEEDERDYASKEIVRRLSYDAPLELNIDVFEVSLSSMSILAAVQTRNKRREKRLYTKVEKEREKMIRERYLLPLLSR